MGTLCSSFLFRLLLSPLLTRGSWSFERQIFRATKGIKMESTPSLFQSSSRWCGSLLFRDARFFLLLQYRFIPLSDNWLHPLLLSNLSEVRP